MKKKLLLNWKALCFLGTTFLAISCKKMLNETTEGITHAPVTNAPMATGEPELEELFRDDFSIDNISNNNNYWRSRPGLRNKWGDTISRSEDSNVVVGNNILSLKYTMQKGKNDTLIFVGGGVISNASFGYGRYETKVKLYTGSYGYHQSFWMTNSIQDLNGFEFDSRLTGYSYLYPSCYNHLIPSTETFSFIPGSGYVPMSGGILGEPGYANTSTQPTNTSTTPWFTFVYDWQPQSITMYLNGSYYGSINMTGDFGTNFESLYSPSPVYITGVPYRIFPKTNLVPPSQGASMQVGYFSYSARKLLGVNILGDPSFKNAIYSSKTNVLLSPMWSSSSISGYALDNVSYTNKVIDLNGQRYLEHRGSVPYKANSHQTLEYIRNGTYKLTANVKCSSHSTDGFQLIAINPTNGTVLASYSVKNPQYNWIPITAQGRDASGNPINTFDITNNKVRVLIRSNANANEWAQVDEVKLVAVN